MIEHLTIETFKEKVFDFEKNTEWKYNGSLPCIIDFYADWCNPCKMLSTILEELSKEFEGKIIIYKVNIDKEIELSKIFGIKSVPTLLFVPLNENPQMGVGVPTKDVFRKIFKEFLKVE